MRLPIDTVLLPIDMQRAMVTRSWSVAFAQSSIFSTSPWHSAQATFASWWTRWE